MNFYEYTDLIGEKMMNKNYNRKLPLITRYPASNNKQPVSLKQSSGMMILGAANSMITSISPAIGRAASIANLFILAANIGLKDDDDDDEVDEEILALMVGVLCVTSGDMNIPRSLPTQASFQVASIGRAVRRRTDFPCLLSITTKNFGALLTGLVLAVI